MGLSNHGLAALVGSELEENLSLRYLASSLAIDGLDSVVLPFNKRSDAPGIVKSILRRRPFLMGISVPFQSRAGELLGIAETARGAGYAGHICAGGHFATFEYERILADFPAVDSIVRHEGEATLRQICRSLRGGGEVAGLDGVVVRDGDRVAVGAKRPLPPLDELPFPMRSDRPREVMGVRCAPIVGSRGCYADCSFCCIYAYAKNARGARYRRRSPENIAEEMSREHAERGVRLFIFNDDNFFVPSTKQNLARYRRLAELLRSELPEDIALVIKCRPNDVEPELFQLLKSMGMIRAYVGIETNSGEGIVSLNRRITPEHNRRALEILRSLDVYCSFNVLIFDPEATLEGIERNLAFMEEFAEIPYNFCRAEVYAGTPLKALLERDGRLQGDYMAWSYEMRDPRVELLFRIASTAFAARNFKVDGVANLNLGIRFDNEVMRRFYPVCWDPAWQSRLTSLSGRIGRDSVGRMREALDFATKADIYNHRIVHSFTRRLTRELLLADLQFVAEIKGARREMERRVLEGGGPVVSGPARERAPWAAESLRLGASVGRDLSTEILPSPSTVQTPGMR